MSTQRLVLLALLFSACGGNEPRVDAPERVAEADSPNRIEISPVVRRNLGITFAEAEVRSVEQTLRVPGAFELRPRARREYRLALSGTVELFVDQYEEVEDGQLLYRLRSTAWQELVHEILDGEQAIDLAKAEIQVAKAAVVEARDKLESLGNRLEGLATAQVRNAELDAEVAALDAALPRLEAEVAMAETKLSNAMRARHHGLHRASTIVGIPEEELEKSVPGESGELVPAYQAIDWIEVHASAAGVVETLAVTEGAFVDSPGLVLSTVDPKDVRFRALALQADLQRLHSTELVQIAPPLSPGREELPSIEAVMTMGLEAHPDERTLTLLAMPLESADWVRVGVSAFLEVVTNEGGEATLAIPTSSVVRDGLDSVFFRRDPKDPNTAIRVKADLGLSDGRWIVVRSGLARGDEVVLDGAYELKLATAQSGASTSGGHVHADGTTHEDH